jgi:hypothetical protein
MTARLNTDVLPLDHGSFSRLIVGRRDDKYMYSNSDIVRRAEQESDHAQNIAVAREVHTLYGVVMTHRNSTLQVQKM